MKWVAANVFFAMSFLSSGAATAADADKVGIKECDEYIEKYQACVSEKVPKDARDSLSASLAQMRASWKAAASTPSAKASLAQACTQAAATAKASMSAYGCSNF